MRPVPKNRALLSSIVAVVTATGMQCCRADDGITAEQAEFFESKIRPVLVTHCYECHSADSKAVKGGLRLDLQDTTLTGGDSGPAVIPGKPDESRLLSALRYEEFEMPPKGRLPDSVIADFERWIELGAPDPRTDVVTKTSTGIDYDNAMEFWAFKRPLRHQPPVVSSAEWPNNDIDRFILHGLEEQGLNPSSPADRRTLIRRACFDLIGLPPEPLAVEQFVSDPSESAFEKVIDDLLASPHYGERWGRYWLDLARFAEDQAHTFKARMYPQGFMYRDWVVQALNDDMPYDQFLRLQIAGDQLNVAEPYRHRAAPGLFALGPVYYQDNGEEGRALADEWDDRIDTLMRGTQALTVACARCHDHKYDPISMADYYGLAGIFASSEYRELPAVPDDVVEARRKADLTVEEQQLVINTLLAKHAPAARLKLSNMIPQYMLAAARVLRKDAAGKKKKEFIEKTADDEKLNRDLLERWVNWLSEESGSGAVGGDRPYLNAWRGFRKAQEAGLVQSKEERLAQLTQIAQELQSQAESLLSQREMLVQRFGDNFAFVPAEGPPTQSKDDLSEVEHAQLKISATLLSELFDERGVLGLAADQIEPLLDSEPAGTLAPLKTELEARKKASAAIPVVMAHALADGTARDLNIFLAGDPKKHGEPALRGFPAILTSGQRRPFDSKGSGRLELADAIASPENPLTARVMANRLWAGHFGFGLVRTLSNFGQLGERPSHPELLDTLAVELMESGWSLKHLHRQIMLSATWQQSSSGDAAGEGIDPENRFVWQMNRRRLEVEPWRDAVLSVSGQLNRDVGGPSSELDENHRRRTLYGHVSRHRLNDLLRLFDFPDPNITAGERTVTTVPLQQLFVLNSDFMIAQSRALAMRLQNEAASDNERIGRTFELLFGRQPSDEELGTAVDFLATSTAGAGDSLSPLEQFCLAMLGTNEFAYVD